VDIDSFSDGAPEVRKDELPDATAEAPVATTAADVSLSVHPRDDATTKFTKELELTVHRGDDPVQGAPLLEIREVVPEGQAPSPSLAAFNKSFSTSHRGELLSVGFEAASIGSGASKILTLWKLPTLVDDTGEGGSEQTGGVARESGKDPHSVVRRASVSQGKTSSSSGKKVTMQNLSRQGSFLFVSFCTFQICEFLLKTLVMDFFSEFKDLLRSYPPSKLARFQEDYALKSSMLGKVAVERLVDQEKANKQLFQESKKLKHNFALAQSANLDLEKKVAELAEALKVCQDEKKITGAALEQSKKELEKLQKTHEDDLSLIENLRKYHDRSGGHFFTTNHAMGGHFFTTHHAIMGGKDKLGHKQFCAAILKLTCCCSEHGLICHWFEFDLSDS
jgi:hypothetical protein